MIRRIPTRDRTRARLAIRYAILTFTTLGLTIGIAGCRCGLEKAPSAWKYFDSRHPSATVRCLLYSLETEQFGAASGCFHPTASTATQGAESLPHERWQPLLEDVVLDRAALRTPTQPEPGVLRVELPRDDNEPVVFFLQRQFMGYSEDREKYIPVAPAQKDEYEYVYVEYLILDDRSYAASTGT